MFSFLFVEGWPNRDGECAPTLMGRCHEAQEKGLDRPSVVAVRNSAKGNGCECCLPPSRHHGQPQTLRRPSTKSGQWKTLDRLGGHSHLLNGRLNCRTLMS